MIHYKLGIEDGIELDSLVGDLSISDKNNLIVFKDTYIDSLFESLLDGVCNVQLKKVYSVDLIEEPGVLEFELISNKLVIRYLNESVSIDCKEFISDLITSTDNFTKEIQELFDDKKNEIIENIIKLMSVCKEVVIT